MPPSGPPEHDCADAAALIAMQVTTAEKRSRFMKDLFRSTRVRGDVTQCRGSTVALALGVVRTGRPGRGRISARGIETCATLFIQFATGGSSDPLW